MVANELGDRATLCYVAKTEDEIAVGAAAKGSLIRNRRNTASSFMGLLGQPFAAAQELASYCCTVVDVDGRPGFKFEDHDEVHLPEALAAHVVRELRATVASKTDAKNVVATVPVTSSPATRAALLEVLRGAGLHCQQLISEPIAAALAYGVGQTPGSAPEDVLVFDMGATQLTVALVTVRAGLLREAAATTKADLGGHAFDEALVEFLAKEFEKKTKVNVLADKRARAKLLVEAELAKEVLAARPTAAVSVESLAGGVDFQYPLNRARFDLTCAALFRQAVSVVSDFLGAQGLAPAAVSRVLLVGGAAKMPKVKIALNAFFGRDVVVDSIPADEVLARGAAVQSALLGAAAQDPAPTGAAAPEDEGVPLPALAAAIALRVAPPPLAAEADAEADAAEADAADPAAATAAAEPVYTLLGVGTALPARTQVRVQAAVEGQTAVTLVRRWVS